MLYFKQKTIARMEVWEYRNGTQNIWQSGSQGTRIGNKGIQRLGSKNCISCDRQPLHWDLCYNYTDLNQFHCVSPMSVITEPEIWLYPLFAKPLVHTLTLFYILVYFNYRLCESLLGHKSFTTLLILSSIWLLTSRRQSPMFSHLILSNKSVEIFYPNLLSWFWQMGYTYHQ